MSATLILLGLKAIAALGVGAFLTKLILAHMPAVNAHFKSSTLNKVVDVAGNAAEDIVRAVLTHADLDALLSALAGGTPMAQALQGLLPQLIGAVRVAIGPALTKVLTGILGGDDAANARLAAVIQGEVGKLLDARKQTAVPPAPGQIAKLADGHLLVVPHGQDLPANATLVQKAA